MVCAFVPNQSCTHFFLLEMNPFKNFSESLVARLPMILFPGPNSSLSIDGVWVFFILWVTGIHGNIYMEKYMLRQIVDPTGRALTDFPSSTNRLLQCMTYFDIQVAILKSYNLTSFHQQRIHIWPLCIGLEDFLLWTDWNLYLWNVLWQHLYPLVFWWISGGSKTDSLHKE